MSLANLSAAFEQMRSERDSALREKWQALPCMCIWQGWVRSDGTGESRLVVECPRCASLRRL